MEFGEVSPEIAAVALGAARQVEAAVCIAPTSGLLICLALVILLTVKVADVLLPSSLGPRP